MPLDLFQLFFLFFWRVYASISLSLVVIWGNFKNNASCPYNTKLLYLVFAFVYLFILSNLKKRWIYQDIVVLWFVTDFIDLSDPRVAFSAESFLAKSFFLGYFFQFLPLFRPFTISDYCNIVTEGSLSPSTKFYFIFHALGFNLIFDPLS